VPRDYNASSAVPCLFIHSIYVIHCLYIRSLSVMLSRPSFLVLYGSQNQRDLPRDIPLVSIEVLSRHGPSDAMHNPSLATQGLSIDSCFISHRDYMNFYRPSHSELIGIEKVAVCSSLRSLKPKCTIESRAKRSSINLIRTLIHCEVKDLILQAGNPVNEIVLKLNLPNHRILKDRSEEAMAKMITNAIQQECGNLQAKISLQIQNDITNHIPSQVPDTTYRPSAIRPRDQDDPHDDAHPEGENSVKR
nr:hypothetical protein [Tanacetum cinerariifolium]